MLLILTIWVGLGLVSAGWLFAYFQDEWPTIAEETLIMDRFLALVAILFGPIGLVSTGIVTKWGRHGWRLG
jgi:hypothetical protein